MCKNAQVMTNWDDLRFVLAAARHGSLSAAARALGVNHATVSRRIAAAEDALGAVLFDRLPSGYVPTEAGRKAAAIAETMEVAAMDLERAIAARDTRLEGPLTITAAQLLVERVLAPILAEFRTAYPGIEPIVRATNEELSLARREADVALRVSNRPVETLHGTKIVTQLAGVYGSRQYVGALRTDDPLDLMRFVHWPDVIEEVSAHWPRVRTSLSFDDMVAALGAVRAGLGVTRMPCFLGETDPDLVRVPGIPLVPYYDIWLVTHPDLRRVRRIQVFMSFAAKRLRALRAIFRPGDSDPR